MTAPYERSAELYDGIYGARSVAADAEQIRQVVAARCPGARSLLDVGCGTGAHLLHLRGWIAVEGIDVSEEMIAVARRKLPGVPLHRETCAPLRWRFASTS
jgi:predicted TPR repeat methyltransferase